MNTGGWQGFASRLISHAPKLPRAYRGHYQSLQAGRGRAAMLVVIFHATSFVGGDTRDWHLGWLAFRAQGPALGVEDFFVRSGAVILLAHLKDIGRPAALPEYLLKRFKRLYPIYWIVLTTLVLEYKFRPGLGTPSERSFWVNLTGYLLVYVKTLRST